MKDSAESRREYRTQLIECVRALSLAKNDRIQRHLAHKTSLKPVTMFTDGNLDKRELKLRDQLDLVVEELNDYDELVRQYIRHIPLAAYDTGPTDADHFLEWIAQTQTHTPEQHDAITCQRSRFAVEFSARQHRLGHVRFQELWSIADRTAAEWGQNLNLLLYLNPIHVWATFNTGALLDDEADIPATVLFFPVGSDIRTAVLESDGQAVVRLLENWGPCQFDDLLDSGPEELNRSEIMDLCRDLAEMGLAAFG